MPLLSIRRDRGLPTTSGPLLTAISPTTLMLAKLRSSTALSGTNHNRLTTSNLGAIFKTVLLELNLNSCLSLTCNRQGQVWGPPRWQPRAMDWLRAGVVSLGTRLTRLFRKTQRQASTNCITSRGKCNLSWVRKSLITPTDYSVANSHLPRTCLLLW